MKEDTGEDMGERGWRKEGWGKGKNVTRERGYGKETMEGTMMGKDNGEEMMDDGGKGDGK